MKKIFPNKLLVPNFLFFSILVYVNVANAGQTVAKFFGREQTLRTNTQLFWYDMNTDRYLDAETVLYLQQKSPTYYYLYAHTSDSLNSIHARMEIQDENQESVNDINFSSKDGNTCNFEYVNNKWLCKVMFNVTERSPLDKGTRYIHSYPKDNMTADFHGFTQDISIIPLSNIGDIVAVGPNGAINTLTAIAVSDDSKQDNVPLTFKIKDAIPNLKSLTLNLEFETKQIANINGVQHGTCKIEKLKNQSGSCTINITPEVMGRTTLKLLTNSYWIDTLDRRHELELNEYKHIQVNVNVGTLFAGYNTTLSPKRSLYRKGSVLETIHSTEPKGITVNGLAIDEPQHKLYLITNNNLYYQSNIDNTQLSLLTKLRVISGGDAQTLGLTDIANRVIVGTGNGNLFQIGGGNNGKLSSSIIHSSLDPISNVLYLITSDGTVTAYYSYFEDTKNSEFISLNQEINGFGSYNIAAYNNQVYAVGSTASPVSRGSKLFSWTGNGIDGKMTEVKVLESSNPFIAKFGGNNINSLFFTRQGDLYAAGSNGGLYKLVNLPDNQSSWEDVTNIGVKKQINDSAVDANGNIYLANDSGIWKVPFDNPKHSYRLNNYESNVSTIAIDNNRNTN